MSSVILRLSCHQLYDPDDYALLRRFAACYKNANCSNHGIEVKQGYYPDITLYDTYTIELKVKVENAVIKMLELLKEEHNERIKHEEV